MAHYGPTAARVHSSLPHQSPIFPIDPERDTHARGKSTQASAPHCLVLTILQTILMRIHGVPVSFGSVVAAIVATTVLFVAACGADPDGPPLVGGPPADGGANGDHGQCAPKADLKPMDPASLPSCCTTGAAHCVPADNVDRSLSKQLAPCTGGFCEPDPIIKDPKFIPATCTSLNGAPGACVSVCVPQVQQYISILEQGTCAPDERCAPCINPLDNSNTGACDVGKSTGGACDPTDGGPTNGDAGPLCPYTGPPVIDPSTFPECSPACGGSHCVPAALVPPAQQSQLVACPSKNGEPGFCAPDSLTKTGGNGLPPACTSVAGAEGRCLSTCIPLVASKANLLPKATCGDNERCAPCFDPTATDPNAPTGACNVACDAPKMGPTVLQCPYSGESLVDPKVFPDCAPACDGAHCVPSELVPVSQQAQLATCPGGFCTPDSLAASGGKAVPATCTSVGGAEGRCLSTCLPLIAEKASLLPRSTCAANEKCAPCFDPTSADPTAPTGACSVACDKAASPPLILACPYAGAPLVDPNIFAACTPACGGAHCVPSDLVPVAQRAQLSACPGGYCAPDSVVKTANHYVPPTCQPFADPASEGRCTSTCLPAVQQQKDQLVQATCGGDELCAPCNDPFTGVTTGACNLACDAPAKPAFSFPRCCNFENATQGTCVPKSNIPSSQQGSLKQDVCPANAADYLCVPNEYLPNAPGPVPTCDAGLLGKGTCVSKCASIPVGILFQQASCPSNHLCVPCSLAPAGTPGCP